MQTTSNSTQLVVKGWGQSKLSTNPDQGLSALVQFLEKKSQRTISNHKTIGRFVLLITVDPVDEGRFTHLNGFIFAGATLIVEPARASGQRNQQSQNNQHSQHNQNNQHIQHNQDSRNLSDRIQQPPNGPRPRGPNRFQQQNGNTELFPARGPQNRNNHQSNGQMSGRHQEGSPAQIESVIISVIHKRYNVNEKYLTFESLAIDPEMQASGLSSESAAKVFKSVFVICENKVFETPSKRQEMVQSISVSNNSLTTVKDILSLSNSFPHLKNLDLSNNLLEDTEALRFWKNQFRDLEHLILIGNPIVSKPDTRDTLLQWYPKLKFYNNEQIRSDSGQILQPSTNTSLPITQLPQQQQPPMFSNTLTQPPQSTTPIPQQPLPTQPHPEFPEGSTFGVPLPGKPEETLIKEQMGLKFSFETKLKMQFVEQCLTANNWNYDAATANFRLMQSTNAVPPEAYIPGV